MSSTTNNAWEFKYFPWNIITPKKKKKGAGMIMNNLPCVCDTKWNLQK